MWLLCLLCLCLTLRCEGWAMATGIKGSFAHQDVVPLQSTRWFTKASLYWTHGTASNCLLCCCGFMSHYNNKTMPHETYTVQAGTQTGWCTGVVQPLNQTWLKKLAERHVQEKKKPFICKIHLLLLSPAWCNEHSLLGEGTRQISTTVNPSSVHEHQEVYFLSFGSFLDLRIKHLLL